MFKLREIIFEDLVKINEWRNNKKIIDNLGAPYRLINYDIDKLWYENYLSNRNSCIRWTILNDDIVIGLVTLANINNVNRDAELHIMIGDIENQNKGAGTYAINEMLKHAFNDINLNRVELTVLESNIRAQHVYEKCGFIKEGVLRKKIYKNGNYLNMLIYSILKNEFNIKN